MTTRDLNRIMENLRNGRDVVVTADGTVEDPAEADANAEREEQTRGREQPRTRLKPEIFGASCTGADHVRIASEPTTRFDGGRPTLRVAASVIEAMHEEAAGHDVETGGIILGPTTDRVTEFVPSGPDAKRSAGSFQLDHSYLQPLLDEARGRGLRFQGVWHVHPVGCPELSPTDRRTARRMLRDPDYGLDLLILPLTCRTKLGFETKFFLVSNPDAHVELVPVVVCGQGAPAPMAALPRIGPWTRSYFTSRLRDDVGALRASGWEVSHRTVDEIGALRLDRGGVRLWLLIPDEHPLGPPDVLVEDGDELRPVPHSDLPETRRWSSARSLVRVAAQALASVEAEREALRLFARPRRSGVWKLVRRVTGARRGGLPHG